MENFTPYSAVLGGVLIGIAATILLWINGRIAGISGITYGLAPPVRADASWRLLFLAGLVLGTLLYRVASGDATTISIEAPMPLLVAGGLLVGFGTQMCGGCTSGHGVCGIARLSKRSMVATLTFMATAGATVFVVRHILGV
ncbi:MAG: YeeE/YedE family protein [Alphaproteobacteria bacterium]